MSRLDNSSRRSSVEPPRSNPGCAASLTHLVWFSLSIAGGSLLISWLAQFVLDLSWWKIFRRSVSVVTALTLWFFIRFVHARSIRSFGLGPWSIGRKDLLKGLLLGFGTVLVIGGVYLAAQLMRIAINSDTQRVVRTVLVSLPAMGCVAVLEELVFRGYVLQQLLACSQRLAVMASSAVYALVHLRPTVVWPHSAFELAGLFVLGWVLAQSVLRTKQLYLAIGLHASLAYCARVNKLVVEFTTPSLQWLVGTNRLVNGLVAWLALLGIGRIVARWGRSTPR